MTVKRLIGSAPSQVSRNRDLGTMAFQNKDGINIDKAYIGTNANLLYNNPLQASSSSHTAVFKTTGGTSGWPLFLWNTGTSGTCGLIEFGRGDSYTVTGSISHNGTNTSYNTASDYRLKEDIAPMTGGLAKVLSLNPVTYKWKETGADGQGFIAHELQEVVPDAVTGSKDEVDANGNPKYQGIDTSYLVATLVKAIQEQQQQIEELKAEVTALKG